MPPKEEKVEGSKSVVNAKKFQNIFNSDDGVFALEQIDALTGYEEDTFSPDPYKHAFNAGMRHVSVLIHKLLEKKL